MLDERGHEGVAFVGSGGLLPGCHGGAEPAELCRELTEVGIEHDLPAYRVTGLLVQANAAAAMNDVPALHRLIGETLELARAYRMAEAVGACECALATFAHIDGRFDEAEQLYTETAERMVRHGSLHAAGYLQLAPAAIQASRGRIAEFTPAAQALLDDHGPFFADLLAVALAAAGRTEEARRIRKRAVAIRPDFFFALFATLRAMAVVALDERDAAAELYATLLPHRDGPLAGATSLSVALRPVTHTLGELALLTAAVGAARQNGASWADIGAATGEQPTDWD